MTTRGHKIQFAPPVRIPHQTQVLSIALLACGATLFYTPSLTSVGLMIRPLNDSPHSILLQHVGLPYADNIRLVGSFLLSRIPTDGANCGAQTWECCFQGQRTWALNLLVNGLPCTLTDSCLKRCLDSLTSFTYMILNPVLTSSGFSSSFLSTCPHLPFVSLFSPLWNPSLFVLPPPL